MKLRSFAPEVLLLASCLGFSQDTGGGWRTYRPNEELRISVLPHLTARSRDLDDVLLTSLDIIFHDPDICCGKNSALQDRALVADPLSLKDLALRIQGRQLLSDGRPVQVNTEVVPLTPGLDISYKIIGALKDNHALLMVWDSHLYVLYGAIYDEVYFSDSNSTACMIHKLLLLDARFSDSRREAVFNRDTDDVGKVQGILMLTVVPR
jgi:hypothetical protein